MMPRIFLFLILGALPVCAQSGLKDGGKMDPNVAPKVLPAQPPGAATLQPGVTAPPPGAPPVQPMLPAAPIIIVKIAKFTVEPGTVREILLSKYQLVTTIKLNIPAKKDMLCHVVSSDLTKVVATDIKFIKGQDTSLGGIQVNWTAIKHDCKVEFKAYDVDRPDDVFHGRLYVKKVDKGPPVPKP